MERVIEIGIYHYINELYPYFSKENKVLYYRIWMKRPQFLYAHIEWLYNNVDIFLGEFVTKLKRYGLEEYSCENQELYSRLLRLNDENDEEYGKIKYSIIGPCRQHTDKYPVEERIKDCGIYAYLEKYGGVSTGSKLKQYHVMITDPIIFECHCQALLQKNKDPIDILFLYNISSVF
jgi:restriction endonuclease S subunit